MKTYLEKVFDWNDYKTVNQYDELSLWSAPFGLLLLENIPLHKISSYLDVGTGTGFPLIDIKQRLNKECKAYGVDPWKTALRRAEEKIDALNLSDIELIEGIAEKLDFENDYFDLITSNLGINNFENQNIVLQECYRVLKPSSSFCITTNLAGHFSKFYEIFEITLRENNLNNESFENLKNHIEHRGTAETTKDLFIRNGFKIKKEVKREFTLRYFNGTTFLNNSIILSGFLPAWRSILNNNNVETFFDKLEYNLNEHSERYGEFKVNVPMLYLECCKE